MAPFSLWALLPSLSLPSSLPFPSVPQSLQRRVLSYLVTRAVGPFLKGGLDPAVVEADLARGAVKVGALELEPEAINALLNGGGGVPGLSFSHGTVGSIAANVTWPLSFSSAVAIQLDDIELVFVLAPEEPKDDDEYEDDDAHSDVSPSVSGLPTSTSSTTDDNETDLGDSVLSLSVAESFIREQHFNPPDLELESEEAGGADSEDHSIADLGLPGAFSSQPRSHHRTSPSSSSSNPQSSDGTQVEQITMVASLIERLLARLSVQVARVQVRVLLPDGAQLELSIKGVNYSDVRPGEAGEALRDVTVTDFEIYTVLPPAPSRPPSPSPLLVDSDSDDSDSDSEDDEDLSPEQEMFMSQSIADLRDSRASLADSDASTSALYASAHGGLDPIDEATTPDPSSTLDDPFLDPDPSPSPPSPPPPPAEKTTNLERRRLVSLGSSPLLIRLSSTRTSLSISASHTVPILVTLDPSTLSSLLSLPRPPARSPPPFPPSSLPKPPRIPLSLSLTLSSVSLIVLTDPSSPPPPTDSHWTQSHPSHPLPPHLRLRLDGLAIVQSSPRLESEAASLTVGLRDFAVLDGTVVGRSAVTVVGVDGSLGGEKDKDKARRASTTAKKGLGEEVEVGEWGEWRGKGRKSKSGENAVVLQVPKANTTLTLLPLHLFLDLALLDRLTSFLSLLSSPPTPTQSRSSTPRPRPPMTTTTMDSIAVLDDLSDPPPPPRTRVRCALVRVHVRCPGPDLDQPIRSGTLVLELTQLRGEAEGIEKALTVERIQAFFVPAGMVVDLFLERTDGVDALRHLKGVVSDVDLKVDLLRNSKNTLQLSAVVVDLEFTDVTDPSNPTPLLTRTLPRNLASGSIPLLKLSLTSAVEPESALKESRVQLALANFTYHLNPDFGWLDDVVRFAKAPAGAFETVVPNELTRLRLRIVDGSILVTPPTSGARVVVHLEAASLATNLMPDIPRTVAQIELTGLRALAVESDADRQEADASAAEGRAYWKSMGFVEIADVRQSKVQVRQGNGLVLPDFELLVSETKVVVAICADTAGALAALASDFSAALAAKSKSAPPVIPPPSRRLPTRKPSSDLLSSVDSSAFGHAPQFHLTPEYLDDDVPSNVDYLGSTPSAKPSRRARRNPNDGQVISDIEGETIKMLDPKGLRILDGFLSEPRDDPEGEMGSQTPSVIRCRLSSCDFSIHIHEGYDWASTRKAIAAEAKAVRRRLEKIRQLLAAGQTADASAAESSVLLFGSVQLGLPPGSADLPTPALLAAIDEELNLDDADDARTEVAQSDVGSWQSLPGQPSSRKPTLVGKTRKRLTRSPNFAIEVNLRDVAASFDTFDETSQLASRVRFDVNQFEIIDNIRTSTWRKFLTELRASDGGVVRASGASMVRFELNKLRPIGRDPMSQEEIAMKIKIFPLRLYIDQDALDFLKTFGAFKVPAGTTATSADADVAAGPEPFFQRVEILPVKIKLDYKPKRVDYHALRQGKTAELMNFFHFDGSEMTLRHLVISGVTRLSDLVQDIWTPDVKANQLADVISGIAPVRSVVNLGSGVANLVLLPIEQYRKDGRLARGLQRGATSFARTTTLEALNVGARLATGTQVILEQAEYVLGARSNSTVTAEALAAASEGSPIILSEEEHADLISRYAEQPADLREGFGSAYRSLGDNFRSAAQTILAVPMEVYERSGSEGPVRAVVRAVPIAVLKPMIGASEAVSKALFGLRNTLDPDAQAEAADKYKARTSTP
ncbi:hypothetical protein RQP46_009855 [Phenoliferia psychrophenolica]